MTADAREIGDRALSHCPVSHDQGSWTVWGNEEARRVAEDPETYSSRVSAHLSVPNGMDGELHGQFREVVDRYLSDAVILPLYPSFERIAETAYASLGDEFDGNEFGRIVAVRCQSAWLGWDPSYEEELLAWITANRDATRSGDRRRTAAVAADFTAIIRRILIDHRLHRRDDPTSSLMADTVTISGIERALTEEEIVSILRNWTSGDLGSIASAIGVVAHFLATHQSIADELRDQIDNPRALDLALDEMLRIDDPFVSNRRITTRPASLGGCEIPARSRVTIHWTSANRDPRAFGYPDGYDPCGHQSRNLVYGAGPHACPGRTLATLELRGALVAMLRGGDLALTGACERERIPVGGWAKVPVRRTPRPVSL